MHQLLFISTACDSLKLAAFLSSNSLFNTDTSSTPNTAQTDDSQLLIPADLARQPEKPITGIPTFLKIKILDNRHLLISISYFQINNPPLKGSVLWKAMLRHCSNDLNNGVALGRAKRD